MKPMKPTKPIQADGKSAETAPGQPTTRAQSLVQRKQLKLIKESHVRFDDYLDLNEESLRRSCKRLMSHLYANNVESNGSGQLQMGASVAHRQACVGGAATQQAPSRQFSIPNSPLPGRRSAISTDSNKRYKNPATQPVEPHQPAPDETDSPIGYNTKRSISDDCKSKSYLRSQYERRQQRQLNLLSKMQRSEPAKLTTTSSIGATINSLAVMPNRANSNGANNCRHQQDMVAKSHELSKRRFFEKLQRRELLKNNSSSNFGLITNLVPHDDRSMQHSKALPLVTSQDPVINAGIYSKSNQQIRPIQSDGQKRSSHLGRQAAEEQKELATKSISELGQILSSTAIEKSANYLIEKNNSKSSGMEFANFNQLSEIGDFSEFGLPQSPLFVPLPSQSRLIEYLSDSHSSNSRSGLRDNSEFEIQVPASLNCSLESAQTNQGCNHNSGAGLLVVKRVDETTSLADAAKLTNAGHDVNEMPPRIGLSSELTKKFARNGHPAKGGNKLETSESNEMSASTSEAQIDCNSSTIANIIDKSKETTKVILVNQTNNDLVEVSASLHRRSSKSLTGGHDQRQKESKIKSTISSLSDNNSALKSKRFGSESSIDKLLFETTNRQLGTRIDRKQVQRGRSASVSSSWLELPSSTITSKPNPIRDSVDVAPEMTSSVRQPGGVGLDSNEACSGVLETQTRPRGSHIELNSHHPLERPQNAAQAQQVVTSPSLATTLITKQGIRDHTPEANEINRSDAVVSSDNDNHYKMPIDVVECEQQVDKKYERKLGTADQETFRDCIYGFIDAGKNQPDHGPINVNHDMAAAYDLEQRMSRPALRLQCLNNSNNLKHNLIEPLLDKDSANGDSATITTGHEDDGGSSCSSSGFGAGSSDGCTSSSNMKDGGTPIAEKYDNLYPENGSSRLSPQSVGADFDHLDSINRRTGALRDPLRSSAGELYVGDYASIVGSGQVYPDVRLLLVENQDYAPVLRRSDKNSPTQTVQYQLVDYANLNHCQLVRTSQLVGYASVNSRTKSKRNSHELYAIQGSEEDPSEESYPTSESAVSGGFSTLPPARVKHSLPANNFDASIVSLNQTDLRRKSSFLKRFGSLVSRAFSNNPATSRVITEHPDASANTDNMTSSPMVYANPENISNEPPENYCPKTNATEKLEARLDDNKNGNSEVGTTEAKRVIISEADLVVLPAKNVDQRKLYQKALKIPGTKHQSLFHDDRLSRDRNCSRKSKHPCCLSVSCSSISSSSSSSAESICHHRNHGRLRRSDSLSADLESLISKSDVSDHVIRNRLRSRKSNPKRSKKYPTRSRLFDIESKSLAANVEPFHQSAPHIKSIKKPVKDSLALACKMPKLITLSSGMPYKTEKVKANKLLSSVARCDKALSKKDTMIKFESKDALATGRKPDLEITRVRHMTAEGYRSKSPYQDFSNKVDESHSHRHCHRHHVGYSHHNQRRKSHHRHTHRLISKNDNQGRSSSLSSRNNDNNSGRSKGGAWGQLISISETDGSQTIELNRSKEKSWGFFVAKGAINNDKGIFISRINNSATNGSLTGLLSVGDLILAIDECSIGHDTDVTWVNQSINTKSKILLKVRPFKG